jgi:LPS sulfotransferase NodH
MQPLCSYLICATPHSGSTLLCEALKNTGSAGWPVELTTQDVLCYLQIPIPDTHQLKQEHQASVLANSRPLRGVVCETQWA